MKKRMILVIITIVILLSSCAYQQYRAQQFHPNKRDNQIRKCQVHKNSNSMRDYYKLR